MKDEIKKMVLSLGADVCGIAAGSAFFDAPEGFRPTDLYAECKSVVVFGVALPKGLSKINPSLIYQHFNYLACDEADSIAFRAAKQLEKSFGARAVPVPSDGPYDSWIPERMEGHGLLSMKHAAVAAGLGELGKSTLLINPEYGNMLTLGAVLTDLELASDPPVTGLCVSTCRLCLDSCPVGALNGRSADQKKCRTNAYGTNAKGFDTVNCNKCRTVCPMRYGIRSKI